LGEAVEGARRRRWPRAGGVMHRRPLTVTGGVYSARQRRGTVSVGRRQWYTVNHDATRRLCRLLHSPFLRPVLYVHLPPPLGPSGSTPGGPPPSSTPPTDAQNSGRTVQLATSARFYAADRHHEANQSLQMLRHNNLDALNPSEVRADLRRRTAAQEDVWRTTQESIEHWGRRQITAGPSFSDRHQRAFPRRRQRLIHGHRHQRAARTPAACSWRPSQGGTQRGA
jgi:hypothetical protein